MNKYHGNDLTENCPKKDAVDPYVCPIVYTCKEFEMKKKKTISNGTHTNHRPTDSLPGCGEENGTATVVVEIF